MTTVYGEICDARDRTYWLANRRGRDIGGKHVVGIGSSEIAGLIGASRYMSPMSLYADKLGLREDEDNPAAIERMDWGNRLEPVILEAFGERTGREVESFQRLLYSVRHPFALCTLDAWQTFDDGTRGPLELKTAGAHLADDWADGPPPAYNAQVQWQMLVTGAARASIACLLGGQRFVWCDLTRDDVLIDRMLVAAREFLLCVENETPPAADGSEATRDALRRLYPEERGEPLALGSEFCEIADALETAKLTEEQAKCEREAAENAIKAAMGLAPVASLPDGRSFTWTTQYRQGYTVKPTSFRKFTARKAKEEA